MLTKVNFYNKKMDGLDNNRFLILQGEVEQISMILQILLVGM